MNQTGRVQQGLGAPLKLQKPFAQLGYHPLRVRYDANPFPLKWKIQALLKLQIHEAMETSHNQAATQCFLACSSPLELPLIWGTLPTLWQTIGLTTACSPRLTFETSNFGEGVPGSPDRSTPSTIHLI